MSYSVKLESQKFMLLCQLLRFHSMLTDSLQVQTGCKYNVSLDASYSCKESSRTLRVLFVIDFISHWRKNIHNGNCQERICPFLICCQNVKVTNTKKTPDITIIYNSDHNKNKSISAYSVTFSKFVFKLGISNGFSSLHQLTESLFQSPHTADDATCIIANRETSLQ